MTINTRNLKRLIERRLERLQKYSFQEKLDLFGKGLDENNNSLDIVSVLQRTFKPSKIVYVRSGSNYDRAKEEHERENKLYSRAIEIIEMVRVFRGMGA